MLFEGFPDQFLHKIEWLVGDEVLPDSADDLEMNERVAVVLKVIDSIGKYDNNNSLRSYQEMYTNPGGSFFEWVSHNEKNGRFPMEVKLLNPVSGKKEKVEVNSDTYLKNEIAVSKLGERVLNEVTGLSFDQITLLVAQKRNCEVKFLKFN